VAVTAAVGLSVGTADVEATADGVGVAVAPATLDVGLDVAPDAEQAPTTAARPIARAIPRHVVLATRERRLVASVVRLSILSPPRRSDPEFSGGTRRTGRRRILAAGCGSAPKPPAKDWRVRRSIRRPSLPRRVAERYGVVSARDQTAPVIAPPGLPKPTTISRVGDEAAS
jgi:hypothetical protein